MKNLKFFVLLLIIVASFSSCEKLGLKKNYFLYDGDTYDLEAGLTYNETYEGKYYYSFIFYSEGITYTASTDELTGKGDAMYFDLELPAVISEGDYDIGAEAAGIAIDFDIATETGTELDVASGVIEVKNIGKEYEFDFEFTLSNGKEVRGNYTGALTSIVDKKRKK